jgi:hypothetical protein
LNCGDGQIRAAQAALATYTDQMIIIPGHGPAGDRSGIAEFRDMPATVRQNIAALKKQGRSLYEVIAARLRFT